MTTAAETEQDRLAEFLARLRRMSTRRRLKAAAGFDHWELAVWSAHYPEEVPLVNGEFAWIACDLADLD